MELNKPFVEHVHHVHFQLPALMRTEKVKEGMLAFVEERAPDFEGQ